MEFISCITSIQPLGCTVIAIIQQSAVEVFGRQTKFCFPRTYTIIKSKFTIADLDQRSRSISRTHSFQQSHTMSLSTTMTTGRSTTSTSKNDNRRNMKHQKFGMGINPSTRRQDEATKPRERRQQKQELLLYPTMERSVSRQSSIARGQQSNNTYSRRGYLSAPISCCLNGEHEGEIERDEHHDARIPPLAASATLSRWSADGTNPVDDCHVGLKSSTFFSLKTHQSNIIGAQTKNFIPSPPNPRRLATVESAHGRLPKSSRPQCISLLSSNVPVQIPSIQPLFCYERIGDPCLRAFRVKLPPHLLQGGRPLDDIIEHAEQYASGLPGRWHTDLYSLTKCDLACRDIPGVVEMIKPVYNYICHSIRVLYGCSRVFVDKNQPHILKYSAKQGHTGGEKTITDRLLSFHLDNDCSMC